MPRPHKARRIQGLPVAALFKPQGVPARSLTEVVLSVDGFEALRLADGEGMEHEAAAARMGVSRPTFSRLVAEARRTVARALVNGWALRIDGGPFELRSGSEEEPPQTCGRRRGWRRGRGQCKGDDDA